MLYRVRWEIDVEAPTPRQAARIADDIHCKPGSTTKRYQLRDTNARWYFVDLNEDTHNDETHLNDKGPP